MNFDDYVGLPFQERGRTRAGIDCWGLFALIAFERFGLVLPSYGDDYTTTADREHLSSIIEGGLGAWRPVEPGQERPGDGVLMLVGGQATHVGMVVGDGRVLHIERGTGSVVDRYAGARLRHRVSGFFRHRSFA